jgi:hypothetical protein
VDGSVNGSVNGAEALYNAEREARGALRCGGGVDGSVNGSVVWMVV